MTTAIIGVGNIGKPVAQHLVKGGQRVVLSSRDMAHAEALAKELGRQASAAPVARAIAESDVVIFAVPFATIQELINANKGSLVGKIIVDPSNAIKPDESGKFVPILPKGTSAGFIISGLLPHGAHYVKAFGTLNAATLASGADRRPRRGVLFYATDDHRAESAIEKLVKSTGFDAMKVGGVAAAQRIEVFGDLHQYGGLEGKLLDRDEARIAIGKSLQVSHK